MSPHTFHIHVFEFNTFFWLHVFLLHTYRNEELSSHRSLLNSHTFLGSLQELGGPSGPLRTSATSASSQTSTDLAPYSYSQWVCVYVCVWSRLDDGSDDTVIAVGGLFFQGHSTPTPPMDGSEGAAEWGPGERCLSIDTEKQSTT